MFSQSPLVGPGSESLFSHTLEVLILLAIAFLLGYLIAYLLHRFKLSHLYAEIEQLKNELAMQKKSYSDLTFKFSAEQQKNQQLQLEIKSLQSLREEIDVLTKEKADWEIKLQNANSFSAELQKKLDGVNIQFANEQKKSLDLQKELDTLKSVRDELARLTKNNSELELQLSKANETIAELRKKLSDFEMQLSLTKASDDQVNKKYQDINLQFTEVSNKLAEANKKLGLFADYDSLRASITAKESEISRLQLLIKDLEKSKNDNDALKLKLANEQNKVSSANELMLSLNSSKEELQKLSIELQNGKSNWLTKEKDLQLQLNTWQDKYKALSPLLEEKNQLKQKISQLNEQIEQLQTLTKNIPTDQSAEVSRLRAEIARLEALLAKKPEPVLIQSLLPVKGIGPKINELLNANGVRNFAELANTSVERLIKILEIGGDNFTIHDPSTWPYQSKLLHEGRHEEFEEYCKTIDAGKIVHY